MLNITGKFIGHSKVQFDYLRKIEQKEPFILIGKSLKCRTAVYPVAMALSLGVVPKGIEKLKLY